jgi:hypothetical protein
MKKTFSRPAGAGMEPAIPARPINPNPCYGLGSLIW